MQEDPKTPGVIDSIMAGKRLLNRGLKVVQRIQETNDAEKTEKEAASIEPTPDSDPNVKLGD